MDFDSATEMSSTVDMQRLQNVQPPAQDRAPSRARPRSGTIATEFPSAFESPLSRAQFESSVAAQDYTRGRLLHSTTLKDMDALTNTMAASKLDAVPHQPEHDPALQITFTRNHEVIRTEWTKGEYLDLIVQSLKQGKLDYIFDTSGVRLAPPRLRRVNVWKRPREREYYVTRKELKGEGDLVGFKVVVDGAVVTSRKYKRVFRRRP